MRFSKKRLLLAAFVAAGTVTISMALHREQSTHADDGIDDDTEQKLSERMISFARG